MKKYLLFTLIINLLFINITYAIELSYLISGDVNSDNKVNEDDAQIIATQIINNNFLDNDKRIIDVNKDDKIKMNDALLIINKKSKYLYYSKTDFSNMNNCQLSNAVLYSTKEGVTLHECITDFNMINRVYKTDGSKVLHTNRIIQNFAITDNNIYFIYPYMNAVSETRDELDLNNASIIDMDNDGLDNIDQALYDTSKDYIIRISKDNSLYQNMYVEYAGHGQSFDVSNTSNKEELYLNSFPILINYNQKYSTHFRGISITEFNGDNTSIVKYPEFLYKFSNIGTSGISTIEKVKLSDYINDNILDVQNYYKKIISLENNNVENIYYAVDESTDRIAIYDSSNHKVYIYKIPDLKEISTTANIAKEYELELSIPNQGFEIYGNYLYFWRGGTNARLELDKVNITSGEQETAEFLIDNVKEYYLNRDKYSYEGEGISIDKNGNIFVGVINSQCTKYIDDACTKTEKYIDIFTITGI